MIFSASWALSARLYGLAQRFAPSNIVILRVHTYTGIVGHPQITHVAQRLGLRMADEFTDVGYPGTSMDCPGLRRLLDPMADLSAWLETCGLRGGALTPEVAGQFARDRRAWSRRTPPTRSRRSGR